MKRDWLKLLSGVALAAALASGTAYAEEEFGLDEWDTDASGDLSYEEWDAGFDDEGLYGDWDLDDDGIVDEDEFGEGLFDLYDEDDDDVLNADETDAFADDAGDAGLWDI